MPDSTYALADMNQALEGALADASWALSSLVEKSLDPGSLLFRHCALAELPELLGERELAVAASFVLVEGDLPGYLIMVMPLIALGPLIRVLIGPSCDREMEDSAFGELGNIVGTSFLNHLADRFDLALIPTPPQVVRDMAGALLGTLVGAMAARGLESVPVVQTLFMDAGRGEGRPHRGSIFLLWIPTGDRLDRLVRSS